MEIILFRHAEPVVSNEEVINGRDFPLWVQRYNESGILAEEISIEKQKIVYTSDLRRSIETGKRFGEKIIPNPLFREAEFPLINFPAIQLKAKYWMFFARCLWLLGSKTRCESFKEARERARQIVDQFESLLMENQRIVVVSHGFIIRLIKRELFHRNWILTESSGGYRFLSKMVFYIRTTSLK
jgi:broad specificity phosphatase PhoE